MLISFHFYSAHLHAYPPDLPPTVTARQMLRLSRPVACAASGMDPYLATTFQSASSWTTGLFTLRRGDLYEQF